MPACQFRIYQVVQDNGIRISTEGRAHRLDNAFIERRDAHAHACVHLHTFKTSSKVRAASADGSAFMTGFGHTNALAVLLTLHTGKDF